MPRSRSRPPTRPTAARVPALLIAAALVAAAPPPAVTAAAGGEAGAPVARLLVGWRQGAAPAEKAAAVEAVGARAVDRVGPLDVQVLEVPAARSTGALAALSGAPGVAYAEPDQEVTAAERIPTDPLWGEQWGLVLTRANRAWDTTVGSPSVVIAVLDSGVDPNHPDLAGALVPGTDFVNRDDDPADDFGHGTSVAAIAAARAGNGGIAGYCWTCAVMPVKVLDDEGVGSLAQIAAGLTYAAATTRAPRPRA
jgi:subtilisin family serine protease